MTNNQGFIGALQQYWTVDPKPRLDRRNTYFFDNPNLSNLDALRVGLVVIIIAIAIMGFWSILGVVL